MNPANLHASRPVALEHPVLEGKNSKFSDYVFWFERAQGMLLDRSGNGTPLFPSMLPYPEVILDEGVRVDESGAIEWFRKTFVNTFVCYFAVLGCPSVRDGCYEPRVAYRSVAEARASADELLGEVEEFISSDLVFGRLDLDGKRSSIDALLQKVQCTAGACYSELLGQVDSQDLAGALPVVSSRVAIPKQARSVDPCAWLPPERAAVLRNLHELRKPEVAWSDVVVACHRVPASEEASLAEHLLAARVAVLVPESDLPRTEAGRLLTGGLFCVGKNQSEDRLIFDRRPENATMEKLKWAELPSGACFTRMLLKPNQYVRGSGQDLRNYYYSLMLPQGWVRYNSVGRRVCPDVVRRFGGDPGVAYRLCFRVLGMGDVNGCDIAQAVHEEVLRRHGVLTEANQLVYGRHVPSQDLWAGAYLDDLLVALRCSVPQPVPLDGSFCPPPPEVSDEDVQKVAAAVEAYDKAGLQCAEHKAFNQQVDFKAWGAEIRGVRGTAGAPIEVRRQLWVILRKVVAIGWCTKELMQKVVGYMSFVFQFRREMYSLQHHVYKFISNLPRRKWRPIPGHVLDELRSFAVHLPFAVWNMRQHVDDKVLATDATPSSGGAVVATVSQALASELWKRAEIRGEAVRLDRDGDWMNEIIAPREPSVFASIIGECLPWSVESSYSFRQTSHINLQELRALRREIVKVAANNSAGGLIKVCLNDSRVVVGAVTKGRSSSYKLNGMLRTMLPHLIWGRVSLALLWVETESNMADFPSRFRPLPAPTVAPPWLRESGLVPQHSWFGVEVFSGSGRITEAHRLLGLGMMDPIELRLGRDAFDSEIERVLRDRLVTWIWLAPPCSSFSPLRNLDVAGPLRPRGFAEGDEGCAEVWLGNCLWRRALYLAQVAIDHGIFVFIEHPRNSKAWLLRDTELFQNQAGLIKHRADWCMYSDPSRPDLPNQKPTVILSNAPWLKSVVRRCDHSHVHGPPLRGSRATRAAAYPWQFCVELADAFRKWKEAPSPTQCCA